MEVKKLFLRRYTSGDYVLYTTDGTVCSADVRVPVSNLSKAVDVVQMLVRSMSEKLIKVTLDYDA